MNDLWIRHAIYNLIFQQLTIGRRPGLLGWLARLFKHPYGWVQVINESDAKALQDLATEWKIHE